MLVTSNQTILPLVLGVVGGIWIFSEGGGGKLGGGACCDLDFCDI